MTKPMVVVRKIITRNLALILPYAACLVLLMAFGIWKVTIAATYQRWSVGTCENLLYAALIGITFFLYLGYELGVRMHESDMQETLMPLPGAALGYMGAAALWVALGAVFVLVIMQAFSIGVFVMGKMGWSTIWNVTTANLLYFYLVPLTTGCIGLMISRLLGARRLAVYPIMLLLVLMSTALWDRFHLVIMDEQTSTAFYTLKEWFSFTPYGMGTEGRMVLDAIYGIPQEAARWIQCLLWLSLSSLVIFPGLISRRVGRWATRTVCVLLVMASAMTFASRGSLWSAGMGPIGPDGETDRRWQFGHKIEKEDGGFAIEAYDMELTLGLKLRADMTLTLSALEEGKDDYKLTLHRYMKVSSLQDENGQKIPFARERNVLSFSREALPEGGKVRLCYSGKLYSYYCNDQALALPAWYCYYPMAGVRPVLESTDSRDNTTLSMDTAEYQVHVNAPYPVYCNLGGENNEFTGSSRGLTLMGSRLTTERNVRGISFIAGITEKVESFEETMDALIPMIERVNRNLGSDMVMLPGEMGMKAFVMPESISAGHVWTRYLDYGDHIWINEEAIRVPESYITGYLNGLCASDNGCMWLGSIFMETLLEKENDMGISISSDPEFWLKKLEDFSKADPEAPPQTDMIRLVLRNCLDYLRQHGQPDAMMKVYTRLQTPAGECESDEFIFIRDMMREVMEND